MRGRNDKHEAQRTGVLHTASTSEIGKRYDVAWQVGLDTKLLRDMVLVAADENFLTFAFHDGHQITMGRRFIVKIEETVAREAMRR